MNTFRKMLLGAVVSIGIAGPAAASPSLVTALPDITALTAEVGYWIAEEWEALRQVLLSVPRAIRAERQAAVTMFEGPNHMIVVAARLAPQSGTAALAARQ